MATLTAIYIARGGLGYGLKWILMEVASATANDTLTVAELTSIKDTVAFRMDTGVAVDCTEATNVVTIGSGPSSTPMLICVTGWGD